MAIKARDQLAIDETVVEDDDLEQTLEKLHALRGEAGEINKEKNQALLQAKAKAERLELPDGMAARVGRFRISRKDTKARSVSFTTEPKVSYSFDLAVEEEEAE